VCRVYGSESSTSIPNESVVENKWCDLAKLRSSVLDEESNNEKKKKKNQRKSQEKSKSALTTAG
jgi:hypothetical protein